LPASAGYRRARARRNVSHKESESLPYYESVLIARQDVSSSQVEGLADALTKVVEEQGGTVTKREHWGLRSLAYRIRKNRKGHYVLFNLDAPPAAVLELERQMRINEDVLRYLTVRVDALDPGPSAMMQSRAGRGDERGRREGREGREWRDGREGRGRGGEHSDSGGGLPPQPGAEPAAASDVEGGQS
jgi:small subunit ribosomal protein S6